MIGLITIVLLASATPAPENCLVRGGNVVASVSHNGKNYDFAAVECREQFLSDPERYSQLYDALAELAATGVAVRQPDASLVPS